MAKFNLEKARTIYFDFMKKKYLKHVAWLKTANYFGMSVGELTTAWNQAKRGESKNELPIL